MNGSTCRVFSPRSTKKRCGGRKSCFLFKKVEDAFHPTNITIGQYSTKFSHNNLDNGNAPTRTYYTRDISTSETDDLKTDSYRERKAQELYYLYYIRETR